MRMARGRRRTGLRNILLGQNLIQVATVVAIGYGLIPFTSESDGSLQLVINK